MGDSSPPSQARTHLAFACGLVVVFAIFNGFDARMKRRRRRGATPWKTLAMSSPMILPSVTGVGLRLHALMG